MSDQVGQKVDVTEEECQHNARHVGSTQLVEVSSFQRTNVGSGACVCFCFQQSVLLFCISDSFGFHHTRTPNHGRISHCSYESDCFSLIPGPKRWCSTHHAMDGIAAMPRPSVEQCNSVAPDSSPLPSWNCFVIQLKLRGRGSSDLCAARVAFQATFTVRLRDQAWPIGRQRQKRSRQHRHRAVARRFARSRELIVSVSLCRVLVVGLSVRAGACRLWT